MNEPGDDSGRSAARAEAVCELGENNFSSGD
jgi:hypothetical protein